MAEKMTPCPFCGNTEIGVGYNDKELGRSKWRAVCYNCGAHGPYENTSQEAMEAWNHRTERPAKVIMHKYWLGVSLNVVGEHTIGYEWICENCKKKVLNGDDYCSHCGAKLDWSE